ARAAVADWRLCRRVSLAVLFSADFRLRVWLAVGGLELLGRSEVALHFFPPASLEKLRDAFSRLPWPSAFRARGFCHVCHRPLVDPASHSQGPERIGRPQQVSDEPIGEEISRRRIRIESHNRSEQLMTNPRFHPIAFTFALCMASMLSGTLLYADNK